jgi:hypothetical protein
MTDQERHSVFVHPQRNLMNVLRRSIEITRAYQPLASEFPKLAYLSVCFHQ